MNINLKKCTGCLKLKQKEMFGIRRARAGGRVSRCKVCVAENYRQKLKDYHQLYHKKYYIKNKERLLIKNQKNYVLNKKKILARQRKHRQENIKTYIERAREYRIRNQNKEILRKKIYRANNKEIIKQTIKKWLKRNPEKVLFYRNKYRTLKLKACPSWLTECQLNEIQEIYTLAKDLQWLSEEPLEVDHIIPLQGNTVCGLHVPDNLRIVSRFENRSKQNKLIEEIL